MFQAFLNSKKDEKQNTINKNNDDNFYDISNKLNLLFSLSYAHRKTISTNSLNNKNQESEIYETLLEHSFRSYHAAQYYFDNIIDNKYFELLVNNVFNNKIPFHTFKNYICIAAFFHDFGKINYYFQNKQMNISKDVLNNHEKYFNINYLKFNEDKNKDKPSHSKHIKEIFNKHYLFDKNNSNSNSIFYSFNLYFTFLNNLNLNNLEQNENIISNVENIDEIKVLFNLLSFVITNHHGSIENFFNDRNVTVETEYEIIKEENNKELLILLEIIFDIILFADNQSTSYFMNNVEIENNYLNFIKNTIKTNLNNNSDVQNELKNYIKTLYTIDKDELYFYINKELQKNIINDNLRNELLDNFIHNDKTSYNKNIVENINEYNIIDEVANIEKQLLSNSKNEKEIINNKQQLLNNLKTITAKQFYKNLSFENKIKDLNEFEKKSFDFSNFHFFKGTTGIGKTNLSFLSIYKLLKENKLNNVKMVFPLITLINQYQEDFENTFQINKIDFKNYESIYPNGIVNVLSQKKKNEKVFNEQLNFKEYKYEVINHRFPFLITSHVEFFEKLFNKNRISYSFLHTLKNSCIILDEIQLYNDTLYEIIYNYLMYLSQLYNFQILVVSATLPYADNEQKYNDENNIKKERFIFLEDRLKERFILKDKDIDSINKCSIFKRSFIVNKILSKYKQNIELNINTNNIDNLENEIKNDNIFEKYIYDEYQQFFNIDNNLFKSEKEIELINKVLKTYFHNDNDIEKQIGLITFNTIKKSKEIENEIRKIIIDNNLNVEIRNFNNAITEIALLDLINTIKNKKINKHILILATQKIDTGIDISVNFSIRYKTYIDNLFQNIGRLNRYMTYDIKNSLFFVIEDNNVKQPLFISDGSFKATHFISKNKNKEYLNNFLENDIEAYYKTIFDKNINEQKKVESLKFNIQKIEKIHHSKMINNNYKPSKILLNFKLSTIENYFIVEKVENKFYFDNTLKLSFERLNNFISYLEMKKIIDDKFNLFFKNLTLSTIFNNKENHIILNKLNLNFEKEKYNTLLSIKIILKIILEKFTIQTTILKDIKKEYNLDWNYNELPNEHFLVDYYYIDEKTHENKKVGYEYKIEEEQIISNKIEEMNENKNKNYIYDFENGFILKDNKKTTLDELENWII